MPTRRSYIHACFTLLLLTVGGLWFGARPGAAADSRPNFVFIYTDDQRWDAMGVVQREQGEKARFPWLKTPNMDRLAAEGVRFRNAFVVNSLCAPSRATFLTGKYGYLNGVVNNHTPLPEENITHATHMRAYGYRTGYVGKWHMDGQRARPGFDFYASIVGQGRYFDCPLEVNGKTTETKGWVDDVTTDYALRFLEENRDRPFSLVVGFKATHGPWQPPDRRKNDYEGEPARSVPNLTVPAIYNAANKAAQKPAPGDKAPVNLNYFRCITAADDNLGRILKALDDLKLAGSTIVVFSSDNGYYNGEHGLGDKRSAYEESMRIPLIVRAPGQLRAGAVVDEMALNVDLAPTWLDYAGIRIPAEMQGRSWRPLLEGKPADWRHAFFYGYFYETPYRIPTVTAVRTETAKLVRYPGHDEWTELFDLVHDPYETHNLIADPAYRELRRALEAEYERQKKAVDFHVPAFADDPDKPAAPANRGTPGTALNAWVLDYRFDQDQGDRVVDASGKGADGAARGAALAAGRKGAKARRFDGSAYIDVPKTPALNPAVNGWTVEASFKAEKPDGVLVACGGQSNGYGLYLQGGKPVFTVVSGSRADTVTGERSVVGEWVKVTARITPDRRLQLLVNDRPAGTAPLHAFIPRRPNEGAQIGADTGSRVVEASVPAFTGLIERVRIYSGELK